MAATHSLKIADAGERTSAFRRARINSVFVRMMRVALPVGAVLLLGTYAVFMQRTIKVDTKNHVGKLDTGTVSASFDNLAMSNPSYEGYSKKDGSRYRVAAKRAITDLSRDKPIMLEQIDGSFEQANGQKTGIKAARGAFDQKLGLLKLTGGIDVAAPNGLAVTLNSAIIDTKTSEITSDEPVLVRMPTGQVRGNSMRLDQRKHKILFHNGVAAKLQPPANSKASAEGTGAEPAAAAGNASVLGFGSGSRSPVDITSASLDVAEKDHLAEFQGNVRAAQDGRTLEAPKLLVTFGGGAALASLGASGQGASGGNKLHKIEARDGVTLTDRGNVVRAGTAVFDVAANKAELLGGVKISAPAQRSINADIASIDTQTNKVVLTGNVVAKQAKDILRGNKLIYEQQNGRMFLASPAVAGSPRGKIFVRFHPPSSNGRRKEQQQSAAAQGGMAFNTNPDAPIEIVARTLDVRDPKSVARFDGGVNARQGDFELNTPVLTAHYDGQIGLFNQGGEAAKRAKQPMKLRLIRATKPVHVSSGSDMSADGELAEFDVVANTITISGNVVLKRGRQIVRGDRLIIDLKTGLSRMKNAGPGRNSRKPMQFGQAPNITANPGARDCGGQMCAVFFPQDAQEAQQRRKRGPAAGNRNAGSGEREPARPGANRTPKLDRGWSTSTNTN